MIKTPPTSAENDMIELWEPQAEIGLYLWLGPSCQSGNKKDGYISNLPKGYR